MRKVTGERNGIRKLGCSYSNTSEGKCQLVSQPSLLSRKQGGCVKNINEGDSEGEESSRDHRNHEPTMRLLPSAKCPVAWEELPPSTGTHLPQLAHVHLTFLGKLSTRVLHLKRGLCRRLVPHSCDSLFRYRNISGCSFINFNIF